MEISRIKPNLTMQTGNTTMCDITTSSNNDMKMSTQVNNSFRPYIPKHMRVNRHNLDEKNLKRLEWIEKNKDYFFACIDSVGISSIDVETDKRPLYIYNTNDLIRAVTEDPDNIAPIYYELETVIKTAHLKHNGDITDEYHFKCPNTSQCKNDNCYAKYENNNNGQTSECKAKVKFITPENDKTLMANISEIKTFNLDSTQPLTYVELA